MYFIGNMLVLYSPDQSFYSMFSIRVIVEFFFYFGLDFPNIVFMGMFSEYIPKGLEATGLTLLISIGNSTLFFQGILSIWEMNYFKIKQGYYDRSIWMFALNSLLFSFAISLSPIFLMNNLNKKRGK